MVERGVLKGETLGQGVLDERDSLVVRVGERYRGRCRGDVQTCMGG